MGLLLAWMGFLFLNDLVIDTAGERRRTDTPQPGVPKPPPPNSWLARLVRRPPVPLGPAGPEPRAPAGPAGPSPGAAGPIGLGQLADDGQLLLLTGAPVLVATRQGRLVATRQDQTVAEIPWRQLQASGSRRLSFQ